MEAAVQTATNKYAHILSIAKQYVQNNYNRDISMDEVAEMVSMSYSYFSRVFKLANLLKWGNASNSR